MIAFVVFALFSTFAEATLECDGCKFAVGKLQGYVEGDAGLATQVENIIDTDICAKLPGNFTSDCDSAVNSAVPQVLNTLEQKYLDPSWLCGEIGICNKTKLAFDGMKDGALCDLCKTADSWIVSQLQKNGTAAEVQQELDSICAMLPSSIGSECTTLVDKETPAIMQEIISEAGNLCTDIKLCP